MLLQRFPAAAHVCAQVPQAVGCPLLAQYHPLLAGEGQQPHILYHLDPNATDANQVQRKTHG
jgi:hypothetical protein